MEEKVNEYIYPYHWAWEGFFKKVYEFPVKSSLNFFSKSDVVLDVGCGDGKLTSLVAPHVKSIIGVDNQEYPLKFARLIFDKLNIKNAKFEVGDITKLKYKNNSFDKVVCWDVIEHVPKDIAAKGIKELIRVLKHDGRLFLTTPNRKELRGRFFGHKIIDKHYYEYTRDELISMFSVYLVDINVSGYYIPPIIPKSEHFSTIWPLRNIFYFLIKAGKNYPNISNGLLLSGTKK